MPTRLPAAGLGAFPCVEAVLDGMKRQPYVHNCTVTIEYGVSRTQFEVFFKRHRNLPVNNALPGLAFRGELLITRVGRTGAVVNMRGGDASMADWLSVE